MLIASGGPRASLVGGYGVGALLLLAISGCSKPYLATDFESVYRPRARVIAIAPIAVLSSDSTAAGAGAVVRESIYLELTRNRHKYSVDVQDPAETDKRMASASLSEGGTGGPAVADLCRALETDAVMKGAVTRFSRGSILRDRGAVWGPKETELFADAEVKADVAIYDGESGHLIWQCNVKKTGMFWRSPEKVAKEIGSEVARKFPYRRR